MTRNRLRGAIAGLMTLLILAGPWASFAAAETRTAVATISTSAQSAILIEAETGRVLWSQNADQKLPMASTTKIITAITALENADLDDVVKVDARAVGVEGSSIYLSVGEELTLEQLLYGLMLSSGNDAAVAIAIHVSGSVAAFAQLMNETAARIGAKNTHLVNPHGLHDPDHYTTAADLAMIAAYAMHNEDFARIVSTKSMTIPKSGESWNRTLTNKNKILWQYEGGNGVKTGYTRAAGRCLVAAAERDGMQLIAVVLNCGPMFEDCMALMDYGFENYECKCVLEAGVRITDMALIGAMENEVPLIAKESIILPLKKDGSETPVFTVDAQAAYGGGVVFGQTAGAVTASVGGVSVSVPLMVSRSVAESTFLNRLKARLERWYTHLIYN